MTGKLRITVDHAVCMGSSSCVFHAPNTFALDSDGLALVVDPAGDDAEDIVQAADDCPTQAIRVQRID